MADGIVSLTITIIDAIKELTRSGIELERRVEALENELVKLKSEMPHKGD